MNKLLSRYLGLVDFLADFLGDDTEVVLHDMTDLENSVVAIRNNHISGREIGAPATDLVLKILKNSKYESYEYLANYRGTSHNGKMLKSATYFIRDLDQKIVGMLCINADISKMLQLRSTLDKMISFNENNGDDDTITETLSHSAKELTLDSIYKVVNGFGVPPERMDQSEKIAVVRELNDKGIFLVKGSVSEAANALNVSEATIYRYIGKLKQNT